MLFVPRQVALASSSHPPAAAMAKDESKKEKRTKSKAPNAKAVVVASVAAFLEAGGFPRALAALQSEASLEEGAWRSSAVSLEDLVSKFLDSSSAAPATVTVRSNDQVEDVGKKTKDDDAELNEAEANASAPSAVQEDETGEKKSKKKKKNKGGAEASEPETKVIEPSAEEKAAENAGAETKEKKHKNDADHGAADKTKKKKKAKSEKIDVVSAAAEADGATEKIDGVKTVKDDNEKKVKKKRKKSDFEENVQEEGTEVAGKGSDENAVIGKKRKLEESKLPATENGTANQTPSNGFAEDNSNENSTISKPSKRQKNSDEPKSVTPFQRVKLEAVKFADERLQDNSYWAKGGAEIGYGAKAQEILGQVRGRGFRHEKTKKKRGTYRGGQIDLGTHSIKFDNSDDE